MEKALEPTDDDTHATSYSLLSVKINGMLNVYDKDWPELLLQ